MHTRRLLKATTVAALATVALAGCVKMDMQLDLQSDDTVDGTMIFAVSAQLAEMSGEDPESISEQLQQDILSSDGTGEMRTEPYDDGEYIGTKTFFEGEPLDMFGAAGGEDLSVVREGDEFVVSGIMDMTDAAGGEDFGMTDAMDIRIAVSFPGAVSDHNGELEGNTVSWVPTAGERLEINARGSAVEGGAGGLPTLLLVGLGIAALVVIGLVVLLVLRSRRSTTPGAAPLVPDFAPGGAPAPGTAPVATTDGTPPAAMVAPPAPPAPPAPTAAPDAAPTAPPAPATPPAADAQQAPEEKPPNT